MHNTLSKAHIIYLGFLSAFSLLTFDLYQPALPALTSYFNTTHALGQLTLSLFFMVFGISQLVWGPLVDHYGRIKTLTVSLILFFIATLFCVYSPDIETLIAARAFQGFTVCCSSIVAFSSIRDVEDITERTRLLSYISMIVSISPVFAPLIGSVIFVFFGWRATFVFMMLVGVTLLILSQKMVKESPHWKHSAQWSFGKMMGNYRHILTHRRFWAAIILVSMSYSCIMIVVVNAAYLLIDNLHIEPVIFALFFASNGFVIIFSNLIGIRLRDKYSIFWNMKAGILIMIIGAILSLVLFHLYGLSLTALAPLLIVNFGVGLSNPPTMALALSDFTHQAATAAAVLNTIRISFSALIAGLVGSAVVNYPEVFPLSILLCTLISFLICWFCKAVKPVQTKD